MIKHCPKKVMASSVIPDGIGGADSGVDFPS